MLSRRDIASTLTGGVSNADSNKPHNFGTVITVIITAASHLVFVCFEITNTLSCVSTLG